MMTQELDDLIESSLDHAPSNEALGNVNFLAKKQLQLEAEVDELTEKLKAKGKELLQISDKDLPAAMKAAGMASFKMSDGSSITVKDDMSISLAGEKKAFAIAWLRKHGFDDIVSNEFTIDIPKGYDAKKVEALRSAAAKVGLSVVEEENVNTATFKALLKEQKKKGTISDVSSLGAYEYTRAKITLPKAK